MKNLKKVLAAVLAFVMVLGTNAFAASFPDLDKSSNYAEAVSVLYDLGILTGYTDGTIKADGDITRAEFAAIVCRIKGLENAAKSAQGVTAFTDVPADHWASGYINMATQQGIINGMGDGTFAPEENVTFEQAVKMVVAALGYTPKANGMGGYPTGYLAVASQTGVTKGVSGANGVAANRETVAKLAYNALDVPIMEQTSFGQGSLTYEPGDNILLDSLDLVKVEATIDEIPGSTGNSGNLKADQVKLNISKHYIGYDGKLYTATPLATNTYSDLSWKTDKVYVGTTDAANYLNKTVVAYLEGAYDDEVTIKAIVEKSGRIEEYSFASEDLYKSKTDLSKHVIAFYDDADNSSSYTKVTLSSATVGGSEKFQLYINDVLATLTDGETCLSKFESMVTAATAANSTTTFDVTLLNNDTDSDFDVAYVTMYDDMVVDTINANRKKVTGLDNTSIVLDEEEKNATFTIEFADGTEATFDDIKEGDVLSVKAGIKETGNKLLSGKVIILKDSSVTGKITEVNSSDNEITIGDETYTVNSSKMSSMRTNMEGTFYVNARGNIFEVDQSVIVSNMSLGFATQIGTTSGISSGRQIEMMNEDGEFVVYDLATNLLVYDGTDVEGTSVKSATVDFTGYNVIDIATAPDSSASPSSTNGYKAIATASSNSDNFVVNAPVAYSLNSNGEVNELAFTTLYYKLNNKAPLTGNDSGYGFTAYAVANNSYSDTKESIGGVYLNDNTVIFSIDAIGRNPVGEEAITVMKKDAMVDEQSIVLAYGVNCNDDSEAKAVFGLNIVNALVANANLMTVTGVASTTDSEGNKVTRLTGLVNDEEVKVLVSGDTDKKGGNSWAVGDVVICQSGAGETLKAIAKIFSAGSMIGSGNVLTNAITDEEITSSIVPSIVGASPKANEKVEFFFGYARELRNSNLTLVKDDTVKVDDATVTVSFKGANFTVYDEFEGKYPTVVSGDISDIDVDTEAASSHVADTLDGDYVFVRVVDGIATDAVIIKTSK